MNTNAILQHVDHRPYPLVSGPWIMKQSWHELLFAHWPIALSTLRPLVPQSLTLDTFAGECWIGVVPFYMTQVSPRGIPAAPWLSTFPELNVRTYVTMNDKPGVYFFSLDAGNPIAVAIARTLFHLPYFNASMSHQRNGDTISYRSRRTHQGAAQADFVAQYRPIAAPFHAQPGTLEYFLVERYCLYTVVKQRGIDEVYRGEIHHAPWPLQVAELESTHNTMALAAGIRLPNTAPLLHYGQLQEVLIWPLGQVT
jgi:uncharacterized protein YqjF (DUF2071 family)